MRTIPLALCAIGISAAVFSGPAYAQGTAPVAAEPAEDLAKVFNEATAAFANGDYAAAIGGFEKILSLAAPEGNLESVYFTLGAAQFNAGQYRGAITTLRKFQELYPKSARLPEAIFSLGQAAMLDKDYALAAASFQQLQGNPKYRAEALLSEGAAWKEGGQFEKAAPPLEALVGGRIGSRTAANGALLLADIYVRVNKDGEAVSLLLKIREQLALLDNVIRFNALAVETGDQLLRKGNPEAAMACYRAVLSGGEVMKFQAGRIAALEKQISENLAAVKADPSRVVELVSATNRLRDALAESRKLMDSFRALPDFRPPLLVRMASAYYGMGRPWEAIVVYDEILRSHPKADEREPALFGDITVCAEVNRAAKARKLCEVYLKEFPRGKNAGTVGYLLGATALQANEPKMAETYFGRMLAEQPGSNFSEAMRYLLADARFAQGKYQEAAADYARYLADYPSGPHAEDAIYRAAMADLFQGHYEKAIEGINAYLKKYPTGAYVADARYRLAVCLYAAGDYETVANDCAAWEKEFPGNTLLGEVLALEGDALAALDRGAEAIPLYVKSCKWAASDEVLNYSLFAAQKLYQKSGEWTPMREMFEEFVKNNPEHPTAVLAIYWIGKARVREGQPEEAMAYLASAARKTINDPNRDAVEQLLSELAELSVKRKGGGDVLDQLFPAAEITSPVARARLEFARAEEARLRRQPEERARRFDTIATFNPDGLSPRLLAEAGDHLLAKGGKARAEAFFNALLNDHPKSGHVDFAYNGLGQIALSNGQPDRALRLFAEAIDGGLAGQKLKELTLGRATALLALNKLDEAQPLFEQAASVREWRGESTACAVYSLGEIEEKRGKWAEANAYYQRVYVAYQRYLPWVARAYVKSANCLEKLGKTQDAVNTYRELLKNEKLASFAEAAEARKRLQYLQQLGSG